MSHTGVSMCGHPHQELPPPDFEPPGDKDFLCVSLPSCSAGLANEYHRGEHSQGLAVVLWGGGGTWDHHGVSFPELLCSPSSMSEMF